MFPKHLYLHGRQGLLYKNSEGGFAWLVIVLTVTTVQYQQTRINERMSDVSEETLRSLSSFMGKMLDSFLDIP